MVTTTTKPKEYEEAVAAAARLMDERKPGWFRKIVFNRLDMQDAKNCIAGQSGLDWEKLHDEFFTTDPYDDEFAPFADELAVPAWKDEVRKRKASARKPETLRR